MSIQVKIGTKEFAESFTSKQIIHPQIDGEIAYIPIRPGEKAIAKLPNDKYKYVAVSKNSKQLFGHEYYGVIVVDTYGGVLPAMNALLVYAKALAFDEKTTYVVGIEPNYICVCDYDEGEREFTNLYYQLFATDPKKFNQKMKKYKEVLHLFRLDEDGCLIF